ncbi:hypothetical protein TWF718_002408 [Orbilia javanica]|uniref:Uncharacterized protein n=1 Tax=Orbilia javanica TaxID=47235 RepID=A0AAN8MHN6_9PEZI
MAYITPSPQRRPLYILATLILIGFGSSFLNPLTPQATIGVIPDLPHQSAPSSSNSDFLRKVPDRKTEVTIDERKDSSIEKHTFITKFYDAEDLPSTLVLVATRDDASWGHNEGEADRTFTDFLDMVSRQQVLPHDISIGLLTADRGSLDRYTAILLSKDIPIASIEIVYAPDTDFQVGPDARNGYRESHRARNILMKETVKKQEHIIWIESDIFELPEGLFDRFYKVSNTGIDQLQIANVPKSKVSKLLPLGIMTVMCRETSYEDNLRNGYSGPSEAAMRKWQEGHSETTKVVAKANVTPHREYLRRCISTPRRRRGDRALYPRELDSEGIKMVRCKRTEPSTIVFFG